MDSKTLFAKYVTSDLIVNLISLFHSPDPRERDYLKTIIHRIYGKCMLARMLIRQAITRELITNCFHESTD